MIIPVRKCRQTAKICFLVVLVLGILGLFEKWRGGKKSAAAQFSEDDFEREIREDEARIIPGLGEGGLPARLIGDDHRKGEESIKQLAMNVYLSDRIAYNRTLRDYRNDACKSVVYDAELPSASVILIFHNEPYSVVLRTVWSVLNSARRDQPWYKQANYVDHKTGAQMTLGYKGQSPTSPFVYLKEIILVDDNSTLPELKGKLSYYVKTRLPPDMIRILRLPDRVGLTRARLAGARYASADELIFLDSHCEPQQDWLRPLLQRMKEEPHAAVVPIIDVIDHNNFMYSVQGSEIFQVGGFTFNGHFIWIDIPEREKRRRGSDIAPTWSATMAGGLFAINRAYFWEVGAYDEQMNGWGGENLEMSFRIWQCGGTLETIPCSRVGHVFRAFHPYGLPGSSDTHGINTARMADVWMDEYAELFYMHRPDLRKSPKIGDVTHRKVLREKLQCKSFQWYLDNVYSEKFVPVRDVVAYGRFRNPSTQLCLDTLQRDGTGVALGLYPCHQRLMATQYLSISVAGQLRDEERCAEVAHSGDQKAGHAVYMYPCRGGRAAANQQKWTYSNGRIQHERTWLCLSATSQAGDDVTARTCDDAASDQIWEIDYTEDNHFTREGENESSELRERMNKLRKQRSPHRISRSLLSVVDNQVEEAAWNATSRRRHRKKHRKRSRRKNKNKFILRIERTVAPAIHQGSGPATEHLEVDIRCAHRRLLPNDTFVRDLVSVLNMHDIRVINNGRVFERNRVSQLPRAEKKEKLIKEMELVAPPSEQQLRQSLESSNALRQMKSPRKHKRPPSKAPPPSAPASPGGPPPPPMLPPALLLTPPARSVQHKIIIEDFVEMPSTNAPGGDGKKLHHLRKRVKHVKPYGVPPAAPPPPPPRHPPSAPASPPSPSAPAVPQSARDALLALLGEKIDKVTRGHGTESSGQYDLRHMVPPAQQPAAWLDQRERERERERERGRERERERASVEDSPVMLPASVETWNAGETDYHRNSSLRRDIAGSTSEEHYRQQARDMLSVYHDHDRDTTSQELDKQIRQLHGDNRARIEVTDDEADKRIQTNRQTHRQTARDSKPVKLTMRNNFTFNIGDEFFAWRTNDDVADILGELAIPSNSSPAPPAPPIEAWVRPAGAALSDIADTDTTDTALHARKTPDGRTQPPLRERKRSEKWNESASSEGGDSNMRLLTGRGQRAPDDDDDSVSSSE